jgi:hypothetical protein
MNKVVELLDFLGGHVVQVRDVYVRNAGDGKLSLLGTVKALESLWYVVFIEVATNDSND